MNNAPHVPDDTWLNSAGTDAEPSFQQADATQMGLDPTGSVAVDATTPAPWEDPDQTTPPLPLYPLPPPLPTQPRDRRRMILLGIGVLAIVALLVGIIIAAVKQFTPNPTAQDAAQGYCQAIKAHSYTQAYGYFASALQSALPRAAYVPAAQQVDAVRGSVTACSFGKAITAGNSASVPATVTRQQAGKQSYTWQFTQENGAWRMTQPPDEVVVPFSIALRYCQEMGTAQLDAAYALFDADEQATVGSSDNFKADAAATAQYTGPLTGCHLQGFQLVTTDQTYANIALAFDFSNYQNVPAQIITLTKSPLIEDVSIQVVGISMAFPIPVNELQQIAAVLGLKSGS
jgi:hypothetical protein